MKTEITKIKLQLKDREIELSADEAREILAELGKLFKMAAPVREIHHHHHESTPVYIERPYPKWPAPWKYDIICKSAELTSGTLSMAIGKSF